VARAPARLTLVVLALLVATAHASPALASERPTAEQRRCAAAERRVARHRETLAQLDVRLDRQRKARAACTTARACDSIDREIRSEETRRRRIGRQLEQFETEARSICVADR
jgi:predicted  nucleic acid-binding Zn-ribbon protein